MNILAKDFPEEIDVRGEVFIKNSDFKKWKQKIDTIVYQKINIHLDDLPDEPYRAMFDNGAADTCTPKIIADLIIRAADYDNSAIEEIQFLANN